jgi:hypothetical protein
MDTSVQHPAMVCVKESYPGGNMFASSFPRNGVHVTMYLYLYPTLYVKYIMPRLIHIYFTNKTYLMILPNYSSMRYGSELFFCAPIRSIISSLVILGSVLKSFSTPKALLIHFRGMTSLLPSYVFRLLPACGSQMYRLNLLSTFQLWAFKLWSAIMKFSVRDVTNFHICLVWKYFVWSEKEGRGGRTDAYVQVLYVTHDMTESV